MQKLYDLAENENIDVIEKYLPGSLKGFYFRHSKSILICLEQRLNYVNKRIIFAEELGHHFTSYGDTIDLSRPDFNTASKSEYMARKWAAEFLIPGNEFSKIVENKDNFFDLNINDIAEEYSVTKRFLEFRWNVWMNNHLKETLQRNRKVKNEMVS